jgi:transcriptional regulator with GAF, ATPase, and Fis domain
MAAMCRLPEVARNLSLASDVAPLWQGTAMVLTAWIEFTGSVESRTRTDIVSLLETSGVCLRDLDGAEGGRLGLAVFGRIDDHLMALLRNNSSRATVLAISTCSSALTSRDQWSLIHAGASDVLQWPSMPESADDVVCRLQRWVAVDELAASHRVTNSLVGASTAWRRVVHGIVEAAAFTASSVLITGESGTGKELVARLIHDLDPRYDKGDFVVVDCTTISPELSGSEFFGHERGAFTGAMAPRDGAFALAHKGTLFLDEVGELRPELQAQLLRSVQERRFKRVGSNTWQTTDFRLVSATNRDLERGVADGSFRADLFYRIAGWRCHTLPLRERKDDILPLARHFVSQLLPQGDNVPIDGAVREFLVARDYPGNVRELRQLIARICHRYAGSGPITIGDIPLEDRIAAGRAEGVWPEDSFRSAVRVAVELGVGMRDIGQAATEIAIELALERESGNLHRAAFRLGVTDRALQLRRAGQLTRADSRQLLGATAAGADRVSGLPGPTLGGHGDTTNSASRPTALRFLNE